MFEAIKSIMKGVRYRMFPIGTINEALGIKAAVSPQMFCAISRWDSILAGNAPWLHDKDNPAVNSGLAAAIAAEVARLTTIESTIEITGSARASYLNEQMASFRKELRRQVEFGTALGTLIFKPYIDGNRIIVDFAHADRFYPTAFDGVGRLTGVVFVEEQTKGSLIYRRLEYHHMEQKGCVIENRAYVTSIQTRGAGSVLGEPVSLTAVEAWTSLEPYIIIENADRLLLGCFRMPLANHIDPGSPMGVSVFAPAEGFIRYADQQWARILWEYEATETALHVDPTMLLTTRNGESEIPKGKERLYRVIPGMDNDKKIDVFSPIIRDASQFNGLNNLLKRVEFSSSLAYGTLSDPQNVDKTAEEIKASKQRSYAMIADTQKALQYSVEDLVYAMDVWATIGGLAPAGGFLVKSDWDDSIVRDKDAELSYMRQDVAAGLLRPELYLAKRYNCTPDEATELMPEAEGLLEEDTYNTRKSPKDNQVNEEIVDAAEDVAGKSLNGAQTQSLVSIISQYQAGQLTIGQAMNIISIAIGITKEEARKIIEGAE